jgi:DNA-binding MarR family transcriptional regulator
MARKDRSLSAAPTEELIARVGNQVRRMGAQSVLTSLAVAGRFGLHTTDLECLDLIYLRGPISAGELAKATGLTSGAMTALIDRLEQAGYVERAADDADRRRRLVQIKAEAIKPIQAVYAPIQERMFTLWSSYDPRNLEVIADFIAKSTDLAVACAEELQREPPPPRSRRRPARTSR